MQFERYTLPILLWCGQWTGYLQFPQLITGWEKEPTEIQGKTPHANYNSLSQEI